MSSIFEAISGALGQAWRQRASGQQAEQPQQQQNEQPGDGPSAFPGSFTDILAGTGFGNLAVLVERLSAGGLDQQVKSWLGTGANLPVNGDQLRNALGEEHVQKICQQAGLPADHILQVLAQFLPSAIDRASPNGALQAADQSTH